MATCLGEVDQRGNIYFDFVQNNKSTCVLTSLNPGQKFLNSNYLCFYQISKKSQPSKRRKVEKPKSVDQPTKKMSEQGSKSEQVSKKNSSKGSAMQPTPLVGDNVLQSLTKDLTFLHNRFSHFPSDDPIEIALPKAMFHYDEDASAWLNKQDVKEFLRGSMLNISLIQIFMRYGHMPLKLIMLFILVLFILHIYVN